ncbi:MAG TPA: hypothetical protein VFQ53_11840 [Kofleriaceae bacterium]|nr:hypothetical protein [Kofleriaceae bacterium]
MKALALVVMVLAACQQNKGPDECDRVVDHVLEVKRGINKTPPEQWEKDVAKWRAEMGPHCRAKFTREDRACMLAVQTLEDLGKCNDAMKNR